MAHRIAWRRPVSCTCSVEIPVSRVIGAGLAGLAAACHLTGRGHEVTVVERETIPGGRAGPLRRDGFTFDTGPTVLTMPDLIAEPLRAVDADLGVDLPMRRLDPAYRACFADGSTIYVRARSRGDAGGDRRRPAAASTRPPSTTSWTGCASSTWSRCRTSSTATSTPRSGCPPSRSAAAQLLRLRAFGRLGAEVRRRFRDPRLHRLFSFQAMYAGLAPDAALALYAVITYMDSIEGVYFPDGGMHAVSRGLALAAEKAGAQFRYGETVAAILRSPNGRVAGVRTGRRRADHAPTPWSAPWTCPSPTSSCCPT